MEVVDRGANDQGLKVNVPQGFMINGWDVNVAGVRTISVKRRLRHRNHAVSETPFRAIVRTSRTLTVPTGVPASCQTSRRTRDLRRSQVRRLHKDAQAASTGITRKSPRSTATEEQVTFAVQQ